MDKQNVIYSYDGILALRKDILTPASTWMNPENIILSEISWS